MSSSSESEADEENGNLNADSTKKLMENRCGKSNIENSDDEPDFGGMT